MDYPFRQTCLILGLAALSACGRTVADDKADQTDPLFAAGLAAPLMIDPDLSSLNRTGAALSADTTIDVPVPLDKPSSEARAAALADAGAWLGSTPKQLPAPANGPAPVAGQSVLLTWQSAFGPGPCPAKAEWGHIWAARMPAALPVYPRGHVQEAIGSDEPACRLRAISFTTPVPGSDVLAFYHAAARKAGIPARHLAGDEGEAVVEDEVVCAIGIRWEIEIDSIRPGRGLEFEVAKEVGNRLV